jgi:LysM repeat protein
VTSPTRTLRTPADPTGPRPTARRWLRRVTSTVTATTAGGVLILGSPVLTARPAPPAPAGTAPAEASLALVSADRHRWPGHPGRRVVRHRVRPGDTATGLAVRFHAWTRELRAINHLGRSGTLYVGRVVRIPVVVSAARRHHAIRHHTQKHHAQKHNTARKLHPNKHRAGHPAKRRHAKPWHGTGATRAQVRRVVVRTARRHGVAPRLALAIAWQESGWQQRRTSSAGAIGVMQVLPGTGRWMSLYVHRRLNIYSLRDNVTAGVVLLRVLRGQTTWRRSIGAYYQGLGAVQRHGFYPSTRRYVRNVVALQRRLDRGWDPA